MAKDFEDSFVFFWSKASSQMKMYISLCSGTPESKDRINIFERVSFIQEFRKIAVLNFKNNRRIGMVIIYVTEQYARHTVQINLVTMGH